MWKCETSRKIDDLHLWIKGKVDDTSLWNGKQYSIIGVHQVQLQEYNSMGTSKHFHDK
jgi:hypothetical protein